jgi:predicted HTH transcriptional regulator
VKRLTQSDLINKILAIPSEDRTTEFKRLGRDFRVSKIIESIVAMANTDGGIIVLGVDDPQKTKAKGLDRVFGIEENPERNRTIYLQELLQINNISLYFKRL